MLKIVEENVSKLENKDFNMYFFVLDTKGNPSSALEYIYRTALVLKEKGYNVKIIHNEKDFVGVRDWLGDVYADLPHANTETENVNISASDFLFIPEIFANVMMQTKKLPCKKVILVQNANNITEFLPVSQDLENLGILDAIVTTKNQEAKFKDWFGGVRTHIVSPSIKPLFNKGTAPQKLLINIVSKEQSDVNRIVKPFYWKNPIYKFVSFRDLRGLSQELFANALREAAITIWLDDTTPFGYSCLEALRSGGLVLAKIPTEPSDWMLDENGLTDSVIWFESLDEVVEMLPSAVRSWTLDQVPEEVYTQQDKLSGLYSEEAQAAEIEQVYIKEIVGKRLADFKEVLADLQNNKDEKTEE